jgi:hypothetical protein
MGHMQHLKSFGVALSKAAETYISQHQSSEASADWRDDFGRNLEEANKEFHRTLAAEASKVADVYYGETEPDGGETKPATPTTKRGGGTQTET